MADAIPPIKVSIVADTSGLKTGVEQATKGIKDLDDNVKTASSGMSSFVSKIKSVGATLGVAFAGQQVLQFGKDVILASSNMAESLSKVQVVFGQNASAVEKWGDTSATAMGISKQAALEAAGTYGNLFQAFGLGQGEAQKMSTSLVQLASDMASFNNTSIDDAILALRSGLSGETEPLKRFGVALNEVRLKQEALDMGLIKSTKEALTPAAKAQAAYALILHDTKLAQGDYGRTADGTANTMRTLAAQFENAKVALGDALMPAFRALLELLKVVVPVLKAIGDFFKNNQDEVKAFAITIGILTAAYGAYIVVTNAAKIATTLLNAVMAINPFVALAIGIGLAVAALVKLYNNSETFRKAVIVVAKVALNAFASIIPIIGRVYEAILKVTTGPLRLLLTALSHLPGVGKYAKAGLDLMNKSLNGVSNFADAASKKAKELAASLDATGKAADKAAKKTKDATSGAGGGASDGGKGGGLTSDQKEKLDKYVQDAKKIQKDIQDAIDEANEKATEALNNRNEKMAEANKTYLEKEADLRKNYAEAIAEAEKTYGEKKADINKIYADKEIDLTKTKNDKIFDLQQKAEEKTNELIKSAAEKRQSIIQQSIDRLRNAFASKTGFDIADAFGAGATTGKSILAKLQGQLTGAKNLQANAGALAAAGYSQTFIEQIVKQGPEVGNQIAQALKDSTPEETKALQDAFAEMEKVQNNGLDALAASMNAGANLATDELRKAYDQVAIDLKNSLATVDAELTKSMADANKNYTEALTEAQKTRDEALADALKTFTEAKEAAQKTLNEGLAEAQKNLAEALTKAQKEYEDAIDKINKDTKKKIDDLKAKLAEVIALIAQISAAQAAAIAAKTPGYTPIIATPSPVTSGGSGASSSSTVINTNITGVNLDDPYNTATNVVNAIKFGNVVVPVAPSALAAGESGAIGAKSIASRTITLTSRGGSSGPRGAVLD